LLKFRLALQPTSHAPRAGRDDRNDHQRHHGHVSIHAPRAGRDGARFRLPATDQVSIHAPRAGRDHLHPVQPHAQASFNPRAPRGARLRNNNIPLSVSLFQSTRPARGATYIRLQPEQGGGVSIHAPRAGRDHPPILPRGFLACFNPRAPRGARPSRTYSASAFVLFQSTRPARGATGAPRRAEFRRQVSIHAPRAGRDIPL